MEFQKAIKKYKEIIDKELKKYLEKKFSQFPVFGNDFIKRQYELAVDLCMSNGKRLRPLFTIMAYRASGGKKEKEIIIPALAFEIYHNYTLIHDDIYDEDRSRRGRLANHTVFEKEFFEKYPKIKSRCILYSNPAARFGVVGGIINGKYLHTLSSLPILESKIPEKMKVEGMKLHQLVSIYDNTGQAIDLDFEPRTNVVEDDYFNMVMCKTGKLFQVSAEWGVVLAGGRESQKSAIREFVGELAIAFQIKDDLMDIEEGTKGRGLGSDIKQRKKTLLAIHALKNMNKMQKARFLKVFGDKNASQSNIKEAIKIMRDCGSVVYCKKEAKKRIENGIKLLQQAKPSLKKAEQKFFISLAEYMLDRKK